MLDDSISVGSVVVLIRRLHVFSIFFLMIRRPPRSTQGRSSAASDVYKRQGIFIAGISTAQKKSKAADLPRNTLYLLDFDGLTVCHLGSLDHVLPQTQLETLSDVDILLIPVGANTTLNANQAAEVIGLLEPKIVIPMHYKTRVVQAKLDPVSKFLKEMGIADSSARDSLEIDKGGLPSETQVIVLNYKE